MGTRGALVASAAAALLLAGFAGAAHAEESEAKIKCEGVNACKGHSECKTAHNECKGQNSCSGQGFVMMTEEECQAAKDRAAEQDE